MSAAEAGGRDVASLSRDELIALITNSDARLRDRQEAQRELNRRARLNHRDLNATRRRTRGAHAWFNSH